MIERSLTASTQISMIIFLLTRFVVSWNGLTVGGGLEKLSQGRNFFFLISTPALLSAYANHEFKIIPTPAQLSAYANHELKN